MRLAVVGAWPLVGQAMLKLGNGPWLFQVLNYAIGPAQEPPPVVHQRVRGGGHASVRVMHHLFCLVNLPFDVGGICLQVHELGQSDKRRRSAGQWGGTAGGQNPAYCSAERASHGAFLC